MACEKVLDAGSRSWGELCRVRSGSRVAARRLRKGFDIEGVSWWPERDTEEEGEAEEEEAAEAEAEARCLGIVKATTAPGVVFMKANTIMIGAAGGCHPPMGGDEAERTAATGHYVRQRTKPGSCNQIDQAAARIR